MAVPSTIGSVSPGMGKPGDRVIIIGYNLDATSGVYFGGVSATFSILSGGVLSAVVPTGAVTGPVTATGGIGTATSPSWFIVLSMSIPSMIEHDTDHVDEALARVLVQDKSNAIVVPTVEALAESSQTIEDSAWGLLVSRTLAASSGALLDAFGQIVGQLRNGMDDATYRLWLQAKIYVNSSQGNAQRLIDIALLTTNQAVELQDIPPKTVKIVMPVVMPHGRQIAHMLAQATAGGNKTIFEYHEVEPAFAFLGATGSVGGFPGWATEYTMLTGTPPYCILYANGLWLIGGASGTILTSPDGETWTPQTSGVTGAIRAMAYGAGVYVAVGNGGEIISSPDGSAWTVATTGVTENLYAVTFANGLFVAVGAYHGMGGARGAQTLVSSNGTSWTSHIAGVSADLLAIVYGAGSFFAAGTAGSICVSGDGAAWTTLSVSSDTFRSIVFGGTTFVLGGDNNLCFYYDTSINYGDLVDLSALLYDGTEAVVSLAWDETLGLFIAGGSEGTLLWSTDGVNWEYGEGWDTRMVMHVIAVGTAGLMVGTELAGDEGPILKGTDGKHGWYLSSSPLTSAVHVMAYGAGYFVAADDSGVVVKYFPGGTFASARDK
jgi:hypothetical protein